MARRSGARAAAVLDAVPTVAVAVIAAWTLAYWVALALSWSVDRAGVLALVLLTLAGGLLLRSRRSPGPAPTADPVRPGDAAAAPAAAGPTRTWPSGLDVAAVVVGTLAALVLAQAGHRGMAVLVLAAGAVAGLLRLAGRATAAPVHVAVADAGRALHGWLWSAVVTVSALVLAVLSTRIAHPDGDDVYFVSFATYVAQHGVIPRRDTILSDQVFPALLSHDPPLHSWESLVGLTSRLLHLDPALTSYSVVLPVMVVVFVLALAQQIRTTRVRWAALGLVTALVLLVLDGSGAATFGFLSFTRLWVGKVVLVAVVVPVLVTFVVRWVRTGRRRDLLMVLAAVVAALGATSTAVFLLPPLLAGGAVAALFLRRRRRAAGLLAAAVPALLVGAATVILAPPPPAGPATPVPSGLEGTAEQSVTSEVLLHQFALGGAHLWVVAAAVVLGVLGLRSRTSRAVTLGCLLVFALVLSAPGLALVVGLVPQLDAVMWRMWFLVPLPLLLAALPSGAEVLLRPAVQALARRRRGAGPLLLRWPVVAVVVAAICIATFAANGPSTISRAAGTYPVHWRDLKAIPGGQTAVRYVDDRAEDGDVVLAPSTASRLGPVLTSRWHPVAPRLDYLRSGFYRSLPEVHAVERLALQQWVSGGPGSALTSDVLNRYLSDVGVTMVCLPPVRTGALAQLGGLGWHRVSRGLYTCVRKVP